jgi:glutathione S-transferase
MLTLFHAPQSRSSRVVTLIHEMGIQDWVDIRLTEIPRIDGTGGPDTANPHPEAKVPALLDDDTLITESAAVMLYLTDMFPDSGMAPKAGDPLRGAFLAWMFWYGNVMEPVVVHQYAGLDHPVLTATFRGPDEMTSRLHKALEKGPYLLGDSYSAADLICHSPFAWFPDATPDDPLIRHGPRRWLSMQA